MRVINRSGSREHPHSIRMRNTKFSDFRLSFVTCTNKSFTMPPAAGERTEFAILDNPVKRANTVPSMCFGVTFANKTIAGRSTKARSRASSKND